MSSHAAAGPIDHHHDHTTSTGIPNKKLFMWAFLASDCMFFGSLISTHLIYRLHPPANAPAAKDVFSIELTSFSTFILLMSSLLMALAVNSIQKGQIQSTRRNLLGTIFFGLIFLGCQVYEFEHFYYEKKMSLSNSVFGSTFYTLTGTHGCHVAIGVLWLALMYIRSFKPEGADEGRAWLGRYFLHTLILTFAVISGMAVVLGLVHAFQVDGFTGTAIAHFFQHKYLWWGIPLNHTITTGVFAATLAGLYALSRPRGAVQFGEANAIDVESMGLYWHFVDIVWIVIFTAVYLLEYL